MPTFSSWVEAARLRTLPLALSSILMGTFVAAARGVFDVVIFILALLTTVLLQVLSNFANDYGDTINGADSQERIGPRRSVQVGLISPAEMKTAIYITGILSLLSGVALLWVSFGDGYMDYFYTFLGLGILAILAAYFYTAGDKPYGYAGLGDISVFLFFGLLGVVGSFFLYAKSFSWEIFLPAISCGLFATGVLNLNNIRDITSDSAAGKRTIPTRLGLKGAKIYHLFLLCMGMLSMLIYAIANGSMQWWFLASYFIFILNGVKLYQLANPDPLLKQLALGSLVFVLLSGLSMLI